MGRTEFGVARGAIDSGGAVRVLAAPGGARFSRKDMDEHTEFAKQFGAKGLGLVHRGGGRRAALAGHQVPHRGRAGRSSRACPAPCPGDAIFLMADTDHVVSRVLGALRTRLIEVLELVPHAEWVFAWIVDAPALRVGRGAQPPDVRAPPVLPADARDAAPARQRPGEGHRPGLRPTLNGWELASGSIRVHQYEIQQEDLRGARPERGGGGREVLLLPARAQDGCPPHGGIAPGLDRIVMLLARESNIREVIAFPRQQSTFDPLTELPSRSTTPSSTSCTCERSCRPEPASRVTPDGP